MTRTIASLLCGALRQVKLTAQEQGTLRVTGWTGNWWIASNIRNISGPFAHKVDACAHCEEIKSSLQGAL